MNVEIHTQEVRHLTGPLLNGLLSRVFIPVGLQYRSCAFAVGKSVPTSPRSQAEVWPKLVLPSKFTLMATVDKPADTISNNHHHLAAAHPLAAALGQCFIYPEVVPSPLATCRATTPAPRPRRQFPSAPGSASWRPHAPPGISCLASSSSSTSKCSYHRLSPLFIVTDH